MNKALLPAGLHDLLYPEAQDQARIIMQLTEYFESCGYNRVEPPIIAFEANLFSGPGKNSTSQTFRMMDPLSHKMMGIRSDMTVQIATIASYRLNNEPKPLRISYAGEVFRVKGEGLHAERQFTQSGIELIGDDSAKSDAEVIDIAINSLTKIGVKDICIDFTIPSLTGMILDNLGLTKDKKNSLLKALNKKDVKLISELVGKKSKELTALADPQVNIAKLEKLKLPKKAAALIKRLKELVNIFEQKNVSISIDLIESAKFIYHTGIGFSIFSANAREELGRGGRYIIGNNTDAVGFTLYVNEIYRILEHSKTKEKILAAPNACMDKIEELRSAGKIVINSLAAKSKLSQEAKSLSCDYILDGTKLI